MIRRACLAVAMAVLSMGASAATPLPMPLAPALPVEVVMSQHELAIDVPNNAAAAGMQFGLLGALIGAGIQKVQVSHAEERVVPLRNALLDFHFNERLEAALRAKLASEGISPAPAIRVMQTPWDAVDAQQDKADMPLHAMVIVPRYAVDTDVSTLTVSLAVAIVDRTVKSNGKVKTKATFSRSYDFHFPLLQSTDDNAKRWADLGSARLSALMDEGIAQTTDMLVYDFSSEGRAQWTQNFKHESATVKGVTYPGRAVRQAPDWAWMRSSGHYGVQMLAGYHPISATDAAPAEASAAQVAAATAPAAATPATASPTAAPSAAAAPATAASPAVPVAGAVVEPASTSAPLPATAPAAAPAAAGAPSAPADPATTAAPAANGAH